MLALQASGVDDDFTSRPVEQDRHVIQNVSAQNAIGPNKVRLHAARIILPIHPGPNLKGILNATFSIFLLNWLFANVFFSIKCNLWRNYDVFRLR
jgi:hypothetical protein